MYHVVSLRLPFVQFIVSLYLVLDYYNLLFRIFVGAGNVRPMSNMSGYTKFFLNFSSKVLGSSDSCLMQ